MTEFMELLKALNSVTPLGLTVLALLIIMLQVRQSSRVQKIETNDLHNLPEMAETLQRIEVVLNREFSYLRARLNGRSQG